MKLDWHRNGGLPDRDMISRWAGNHSLIVKRLKTIRASPHTASESGLRPLGDDDEDFVCPTLQELRKVKVEYLPPAGAIRTEDSLLTLHDRLWIPPDAAELLQRMGIVHFDYLYMGENYGDSKYLLVLKDHASHYCELSACDAPQGGRSRLQQRRLSKKRERGENLENFAVSDYVLRSRVDEKHGNKLQVTWVGPYCVVHADAHLFGLQHLVTGDELDVHASWLKVYGDRSLEVTDERLEHVSSQGIILAVDKLNEHQWNGSIKDYAICVSWKGIQQIDDSYEPVKSFVKEIRVLIDNYATKANGPKFTEYRNKLQVVVMEPTLSLPPTRSQPPAAHQPRASQDTVDQPQRRTSNRKGGDVNPQE
ncbi:unnamed protein product [Phytophthora fragariaefolia]|uniref:Unnamed protein product n=1 Tax=Phytophthora fragariaefolia TaxID=1490495 RepID=A0A9W6TWI7_9STRA|nr:unnamed protein product [Phytophthora fragariaefolia]